MEKSFFQREKEVLGSGLAEGLAETVHTTWKDVKDAARSFAEQPLDTSAEYLKNHWQDAVAGALISVVNPRGMANAFLIGWSMRGLGTATWSAVKQAASPNADLTAASAELKQAVSHQGTAFLASLPMAMVGSSLGRAAADGVFGRDLALSDLAAGKVSAEKVRSNLIDLYDTVNPPKVKLVVSDLDGTAWPFYDYFVPAMRENIADISAKMGLPPREVAKSIGKVMDEQRTHEYPWSLEKSELARKFQGSPAEFSEQIVRPFWETLDRYRLKYLKPFPEVNSTLAELGQRGVDVAALSDAPFYMGYGRAIQLGLDSSIKRLYALDTAEPSAADLLNPQAVEFGRGRVKSFEALPSKFEATEKLPRASEKPNPAGLDKILSDFGVRPSQVRMIGDSRVKDGGVAAARGIPFIWARHGAHLPAEYEEMISSTLKPESAEPAAAPAKKAYPPIAAESASYAEILKHLDPTADYRALIGQLGRSLWVLPRAKSALAYDLFPGQNDRI